MFAIIIGSTRNWIVMSLFELTAELTIPPMIITSIMEAPKSERIVLIKLCLRNIVEPNVKIECTQNNDSIILLLIMLLDWNSTLKILST